MTVTLADGLLVDADASARDFYLEWFSSIGCQVMCEVGVLGLLTARNANTPTRS
jgi:hypothetical protein